LFLFLPTKTTGKKKPESGGQLPKRPSRKAFFESTTQDSGEKEENSLPLVIAGSTKASFRESKNHLMTGVPIPCGSRALIPPSPPLCAAGKAWPDMQNFSKK
jgi:hypothetical protein